MTQNSNPKVSLAQKALDLMDSQGEEAMLAFAADNQDTAPSSATHNLACMVLADHSVILAAKDTYTFAWTEENTAQTAQRPRDPHRFPTLPQPEPRPVTMYPWPNDHSVLQRVLVNIQDSLVQEMDQPPEAYCYYSEESLLSTAAVYRACPALREKAAEALQQGHTGNQFQELDQNEGEAANKLEDLLTPELTQRVENLISQAIRNIQPERSQTAA